MRKRLLKLNTFFSLANQLITIACGFVLPRLILMAYGSEVNGLVNSIMQFLQIISFLELGVGAVVQSALYKPLADHDSGSISCIIASAQKFFNRLAQILFAYVIILMAVYPLIAHQGFGWMYTALMIAAISISSFAQYFFGMVNGLLLKADQRGYVLYVAQLVTVLLNTVVCVILIKLGAGIHFVKLTTSIIYLIRPFALHLYVNRHYAIDRHIKYEGEPIKQKWNGVAQHIAAVVLDGTDNIVLTAFATLSDVSIYSAYQLVVHGVKSLFFSLSNGVQALIGELWAKQELDTLNDTFGKFEWILHTGTVYVFGCTGMLILPFVSVYTNGVTDANYMQPVFAVLITMANAGHCLRLPYNVMILAGGHYKQTQANYIIAAAINVVLSVVLVMNFGLIGVAIGTLASMVFQTVWMAHYVSRNLIHWPFVRFVKQVAVDLLTVCVAAYATHWIQLGSLNYLSWVVMAIKVAIIWLAVLIPINFVFYKKYAMLPINAVKRRISR